MYCVLPKTVCDTYFSCKVLGKSALYRSKYRIRVPYLKYVNSRTRKQLNIIANRNIMILGVLTLGRFDPFFTK